MVTAFDSCCRTCFEWICSAREWLTAHKVILAFGSKPAVSYQIQVRCILPVLLIDQGLLMLVTKRWMVQNVVTRGLCCMCYCCPLQVIRSTETRRRERDRTQGKGEKSSVNAPLDTGMSLVSDSARVRTEHAVLIHVIRCVILSRMRGRVGFVFTHLIDNISHMVPSSHSHGKAWNKILSWKFGKKIMSWKLKIFRKVREKLCNFSTANNESRTKSYDNSISF